MTLFTNGYVTLQTPKDFDPIQSKGDFVELSNDNQFISSLLPRKNHLNRPKVSNIDCALVVCALKEPELDLIQLNRYLTYLKFNNIAAR